MPGSVAGSPNAILRLEGLCVLAATLALAVGTSASAESRARPHYTADELHEQATWVFEGVVCAIETVSAYDVSFPVEARVRRVVKGRWTAGTMTFRAPPPGLHAIFEQEFEPPEVGRVGTFYVHDRDGVRRQNNALTASTIHP